MGNGLFIIGNRLLAIGNGHKLLAIGYGQQAKGYGQCSNGCCHNMQAACTFLQKLISFRTSMMETSCGVVTIMAPSTFEAFKNCAMEMCSSDVLQNITTMIGTMAIITITVITIYI